MQNISNVKTQENPRTLTILAPKTNIPIDIVFEYVSPAMATKWLGDNISDNRTVNQSFVKAYAKAMKEGLWDHSNGESIAFNQDYKLVNGQHRLHAIVQAGISVWMLVMYGVSKDAILTLDDGNPRTLADAMKVNGIKIMGRDSTHSSAIRLLSKLKEAFATDKRIESLTREKSTNNTLIDFYKKLPDYNMVVEKLLSTWNYNQIEQVVPGSVSVSMYYLFHNIYPEAIQEMYQTWYDKIPADMTLGKKSPAFMMMRKIQRMREDDVRIRPNDYINMFIFTMLKTVEHKPVKQMPLTLNWQFRTEFEGRLRAKQKLQRT